jgi:hypothetical protein
VKEGRRCGFDGVESHEFPIRHFAIGNPIGEGEGDVPMLLRSVAKRVEALGPQCDVIDITFRTHIDFESEQATMTVYYNLTSMR